ncbi:MAG: VPLPA-CTERM sorting domain-containing protein [Sinobacterium sp.]
MKITNLKTITLMAAICSASAAQSAVLYSNDFEGTIGDASISDFVIGLQSPLGGWWENAAAPNQVVVGQNGFSKIVDDQGGVDQGSAQLNTYSDYNGWSPFNSGQTDVLTKVYAPLGAISPDLEGQTVTFSFDAKLGNITDTASSTANAFLAVIKTSDGSYADISGTTAITNSDIGSNWGSYSISVLIDSGMVGEELQIGFSNQTVEAWGATGMYYDNLEVSAVPVPAAAWLFGSALAGLVVVRRNK